MLSSDQTSFVLESDLILALLVSRVKVIHLSDEFLRILRLIQHGLQREFIGSGFYDMASNAPHISETLIGRDYLAARIDHEDSVE